MHMDLRHRADRMAGKRSGHRGDRVVYGTSEVNIVNLGARILSLPGRTANALRQSILAIFIYRRILFATTRVELSKRYAGTLFGPFWVALQPLLFLGVYLFVYLVVFKVRFPGYSDLYYVVYVFSGLVPYITLMEALTQGVVCIKQNIHLVKNVMLPIDLIPARTLLMSITTQMVGLGLLLVLSAINGTFSLNILLLPIAIFLQVLFLLGLVWMFSALGVLLPDLSYFVGNFLLLLLFLSPIAYMPNMVSPGLSFLVDYNPIHYMMELFRICVIGGYAFDLKSLGIAVLGSASTFVLGCVFFRRFRNSLLDYE